MLNNCTYDKIKLLHEISCLAWFIEHHALPEAQESNAEKCKQELQDLKKDLDKHIGVLKKMVCSCD